MSAALRMPVAGRPSASSARDETILPRLLLIADGFVSGRAGLAAEAVRERVATLVAAGVRAVQLRDHAAEPEVYATAAAALAVHLRTLHPDVVLVVNGRPDVARALGAVLHVGRRGPSVEQARRLLGDDALLSYSAHSPSDARRAADAGADVLLVSPLFRTVSHPGVEPGELHLLRRTCDALAGVVPQPFVYALGGITPGHVADCLQAGAHGVAVLSGLLDAADPEEAARAYLGAFR